MTNSQDRAAAARALEIPLNRDVFTRTLIRELAGALEDVVGIEEASGYISIVGSAIGEQINQGYRRAYEVSSLSREQVARRAGRSEASHSGQLLRHRGTRGKDCPRQYGLPVRREGHRATVDVHDDLERIRPYRAENLGYGKVELQRTIAEGHPECRVVVYLRPTAEAEKAEGREYQRSIDK
jgi:hypothetical protein